MNSRFASVILVREQSGDRLDENPGRTIPPVTLDSKCIRVKTELIFGSFYYGQSLGFKLFSVPVLIGVNWAILLYSTAQLSKFKNHITNALFGAGLMVGLDFFIEQNASKFDFWYWNSGHIPVQNYVAWFLVSFLLNLIVQKHLSQKPNFTAKAFYFVQLAFFSALYFFS